MAAHDDKPSFEQLWRKLEVQVRFAVARHRSRDVALAADDLAQEVRIRVWEIHRRDTNAALNTSYYMKVVNSAIIDALRRHRGTLAHSVRTESDDEQDFVEALDSHDPGPEVQADRQSQGARLKAALDSLPGARRRATMLYLQGFTVPEIAEILKCDKSRAHNLTYRGVADLKRRMSETDEQP